MIITNTLFKRRDRVITKKRSVLFRILNWLKWIVLIFFASSIFMVIVYKFINPPVTPLMVIRVCTQIAKGEKIALTKDWTLIEHISPNMIRAVIASEDNLFVRHKGFDTQAIENALEHNKTGKRIRGGSTISQQTAKNVFLWPSRTYLRKGLEVYFTFLIEKIWGKARIMEVYLNVIEIGKGIYGVEKASQIYFQKSSMSLTAGQAALIAAILPSPLRYSITNPGPYVRSRQAQLVELMPNIETLKITPPAP
jgi:monofunctional glycosyltransferase